MKDSKRYEDLAKHLDQGIVGSPRSPALIEMLEILFPGEEAEVALRLPMQDSSLSELKELFPEKAKSLEGLLKRMARRGTVFVGGAQGEERSYKLLPSVVGWAETPYWAGKEDRGCPPDGAAVAQVPGRGIRGGAGKGDAAGEGDPHIRDAS